MTDQTHTDALVAVDQTVLGIGNPRGNCFQACLSMISGLPIDQCIDITDPAIEGGQWIEPVEQWAESHGLRFVTAAKSPKDRPYIANGPTTKREGLHGVVCIGKELFHDPHPSRDGLAHANWYAWLETPEATTQAAQIAALTEALTPSGDTKSAYMGEFYVRLPDLDDDGNEVVREINVPWTTIKEIMVAIRTHALTPKDADQ